MISAIGSRAGRRVALLAGVCAVSCLAAAGSASAHFAPGGQLLKLTHLGFNTNTSSNWFGYQQGSLEQGGKLFTQVAGNWTVPTATQHTSGQAEDSADWIGIGGGCVDTGCAVGDPTLIQTGTEQDVSASGSASYDAWYELVPAPELQITSMTVKPGDQMHASISQAAPEVWNITIQDLTQNETYSTTVPYSSTMDTAEWIEETPLMIGTNAGFAALPNLTDPAFNSLTVNGANPGLKSSEQIQLTDSSGNVIGTPSAPNSTGNGFSECTWTSTCP
ncbi:MAG TPA: G1 family glutamic endopeptidase [Solirubrobacteraceae bacterium]|nr:G1 family glutamic endopeptidase [Solirubrobacteraceae bacterium]